MTDLSYCIYPDLQTNKQKKTGKQLLLVSEIELFCADADNSWGFFLHITLLPETCRMSITFLASFDSSVPHQLFNEDF